MVDGGGGGVEGKERGGQHGVTVISSARKGWSRVIINSILRLSYWLLAKTRFNFVRR